MFIYIFIIQALLNLSVLCDFSCYDCSENILDYTLTDETVPTQFNNCTLVTGRLYCYIHVQWEQNPAKTKLQISGYQYWKLDIMGHDLEARASISYDESQLKWSKVIRYRCLTNECNSPTRLTYLLKSLKFVNRLEQLQYLIEPNETFDGQGCLVYYNETGKQISLPTQVHRSAPQQCRTMIKIEPKRKVINAERLSIQRDLNSLKHYIEIDINNRIRSSNLYITCQKADCNSLNTVDLIYRNSFVDFNMEKFIDQTSNNSQAT
ncbi:unnamed protein product [Adineta ricciae]|uniref:Uncharacterized protein n=1 Tax=Adineta ricciae TaxID=249248 RepID=A0A815LDG0_ADIRI|nr:unnamed protein product [Adineta ricciae]